MSKPSHIAYVVTEPKDKGDSEGTERKAFWRAVGAVFPHGKGNGFDLLIHEQIAISGRIVCTEPKEKNEADAEA